VQAFPTPDIEGLIRIGASRHFEHRISALRAANAYPLRVLGVVETPRHALFAMFLHFEFAQHRVHDDWFVPVPAILDYIAQRAQLFDPVVDPLDEGELITTAQLAHVLSLSVPTVRRWIRSASIPFYVVGRRKRFRISEVRAALDARRDPEGSST
jgi:excisionase family DNA binding protein